MHEVAQPTTPVLRLASPAARRLAPPLILCAATLAAVVPALLSSRPGIRSVALPMFASGAALTFGVGLYDLARGHNLRFARALVGTGVLWSLSALEASPEPT